jgi:hypothetical protein
VTTAAYVRTQAAVAGLINAVVNPVIDWFSARHMGLRNRGADGLVVNFVITSLLLSTLVGLLSALGARRLVDDGTVTPRRWLRRLLPPRGWLAGLMLGAGAAVVVIAASWLLHAAGVTTSSLAGLMTVKAVYCGLLGFLVARWVIMRVLPANIE